MPSVTEGWFLLNGVNGVWENFESKHLSSRATKSGNYLFSPFVLLSINILTWILLSRVLLGQELNQNKTLWRDACWHNEEEWILLLLHIVVFADDLISLPQLWACHDKDTNPDSNLLITLPVWKIKLSGQDLSLYSCIPWFLPEWDSFSYILDAIIIKVVVGIKIKDFLSLLWQLCFPVMITLRHKPFAVSGHERKVFKF